MLTNKMLDLLLLSAYLDDIVVGGEGESLVADVVGDVRQVTRRVAVHLHTVQHNTQYVTLI